jgi:hypothetical protein
MTDAQKSEILTLRAQNVPFNQIAARMGVPKATIKSFCQRLRRGEAADNAARCEYCGKPMLQLPRRKQKRFCSDVCRYAFHNRHRTGGTAVCAYCGAEFNTKGNASRKYCGIACSTNARWGAVDG